jgi:hypothetical protein
MDVRKFISTRPYAYHLTARSNLRGIRAERSLLSAAQLAKHPWEEEVLGRRRRKSVEFERATIRDQSPLHQGSIGFAPDFGMAPLLALLNSLVYFWPGRDDGPMPSGQNHYARYAAERPALLRIRVDELLAQEALPLVSRYNSGAPRCVGGEKSPRGPETFLPVTDFAGAPSKVIELAFKNRIDLPSSTEVGDSYGGPWKPLF